MFTQSSQVPGKKLHSWPSCDLRSPGLLDLIFRYGTTGDWEKRDWCAILLQISGEFGKGFFVFEDFVAIEGEKSFQLQAGFFRCFSEILEVRDCVDWSNLKLEFWLEGDVWKRILYFRFAGASSAAFFSLVSRKKSISFWPSRREKIECLDCVLFSQMKKSKWLKSAQVISVADSKNDSRRI